MLPTLFLLISIFLIWLIGGIVVVVRNKREDDAAMKEVWSEEKKREYSIWCDLKRKVADVFHVELDTIDESFTQDEIVRQMNILAKQAAEACMNQDKAARGEAATYNLGQEAYKLKVQWSKAKELALQVCPKLADRLPHFSEFEPLKSSRKEYLAEKLRKNLQPNHKR